MIAILLLSAFFMILILLAVLMLVFSIKGLYNEQSKRFDDLEQRINDTHKLVTKQVKDVMDGVKKIVNN